MKTRKNILIVLGLVLLLGGSYAFYTYQKYSGMQNLLNGEIYLNYLEDNEVHISGIFPETKEEALKRNDNTISFKVLSKNTSDKDIYYGITLNYGEEISNKVRIDAKYIMIYLECDGKVLIDGIRYSDFNNRRIYVDKIDAKTYTETTKNYTLRFWVDEETTISDTDSNASYKAMEWANSYLNFKVNVDAGLETMNMPLSMETSDTYVENNKAYFIAKISNFINIEDLGKDSNDTMNLKVTGTNSDIKFSYKDSEGNTVEEKSDTLDLTYLFTKNKTVEIQVFVHPNNDANGKTNVLLEIYKNKELMQSFIKRVEVKGNNYCLNNGFNKLVDCVLVSDSLSESVDVAKTNIANKGEPNLNDTAPSYTYVEQLTENVENVYSATGYKFLFSKTYDFDTKTGKYTLTGSVITDYLSDKYINYFSTGHTSMGVKGDAIYKINNTSVDNNKYTIANGDILTSKVASSIRSEVGLYKAEDDYGDVYYYRGDVQNNNVYFGGFYWKIIRTNGDGSLRVIYNGKAGGQLVSINNTNYIFNEELQDLTSLGYMYGQDFEHQVSDETIYGEIPSLSSKCYASSFIFNEDTKKYRLDGNKISASFLEMKDKFDIYPYTCFMSNVDDECLILIKVNSYINDTSAWVQYYTYSSKNLESTRTNENDSSIKKIIDAWYFKNIYSKSDKYGYNLTDYIVDGTFCNDRSFFSGTGYKIDQNTLYNSMKRLNNGLSSFKCNGDVRDSFSVTSKYGNAKLTYPVALITADEVALAGGKVENYNPNFYLSAGYTDSLTMTPNQTYNLNTYMWGFGYRGRIYRWASTNAAYTIRPVINISSDVLISSGDGTIESSYQLKLK